MNQEKLADAVIVHGPQGCGKTRHAGVLAKHFGVARIIDEWRPGDPIEPDTLHLSQMEVPGAVAYESLKASLKLCDTCHGTREIRRPYSAVERIPCPICTSAQS